MGERGERSVECEEVEAEVEAGADRRVMCSSVDQHVVGLWYMISVSLDSNPASRLSPPPRCHCPLALPWHSVSADR